MSVAAVGVGIWLGWGELLAVGAALGFIGGVGALAVRAPSSARWQDVSVPVRVTRGDEAWVRIGVSIVGSSRWVSATGDSGSAAAVRAWVSGSDGSLAWPVPTGARGSYPIGPTRLEFADPFGLRRRVLARREQTHVLVVPRVSPAPVLMPSAGSAEGGLGEVAGTDAFHSLREYVVGDPMKAVHWRSSARTGTLMVRRTVDTTLPWLMVVLDVDRSSYPSASSMFGDYSPELFESAVDLAASWAWANCTTAQRVLLTTTAASSPAIEVSIRSRESALDWLAHVTSVSASLPQRVTALARRHSVGRIVLITGPAGRLPHRGSAASVIAACSRFAAVTVARADESTDRVAAR
jgi:uncharacterized protein (DUF58 family)